MLQGQISGFRLRACRNDGFVILDSSELSMQFCKRTLLNNNTAFKNIMRDGREFCLSEVRMYLVDRF